MRDRVGTMAGKIIPVILAGGKGTRLWPLSRASSPKQFLQILEETTLFQQTLARVSDQSLYHPPIIVTNADFRFLVAEQARAMHMVLSDILLEPVGRNTTPAIAAAAIYAIRKHGEHAIIHVMASDHDIISDAVYFDCVKRGQATVEDGYMVTFGITPTEPATGYGYIETGNALPTGAKTIARFVEKPDQAGAEQMIKTGQYLWNSGSFMLDATQFLEECKQFVPYVFEFAREACDKAVHDLDFERLDLTAFEQCPDISVDYAIFEKTRHGAVVPSSFAWSDLGSWDSVWKSGKADPDGNVSDHNATLIDTRNSLVLSKGMHIAVQGMSDVAVIASEDAIYVGRLDEAQKVSGLVKSLAAEAKTVALTETHMTEYRPWGGFTTLINRDRFKVRRIFIHPGQRISLQKHFHRSENWTILSGTAEVTIGEKRQHLAENQSASIAIGEKHRIANPGKIMLEFIEVQTGDYLGDDDIVRFEDEHIPV
jgi:mannose-1-phosphate guanylyltransferase